jgi:hypothetical protein
MNRRGVHRRPEPELPQRNVRIAEPIDFDAADVGLEEPLVGVVPDRNDRRVVHDQLLGPPVELDASLTSRSGAAWSEDVIHRRRIAVKLRGL